MGKEQLEEISLKKPTILLACNYSDNRGTGHLKRMLKLLDSFSGEALIYMTDSSLLSKANALGYVLKDSQIERNPEKGQGYRLIIIDNFSTSKAEVRFFLNLAPVVALDEGGIGRHYATYLIDLLPMIRNKNFHYPNEQNLGYLDLPVSSSQSNYPPRKILVSFGGQDEAGLTEIAGNMLDMYELKEQTWDVVKGGLVNRTFAWPGVKILENVELKDILSEYDLVITHFGLTAFEAISSGANVVLLNPSDYHQKLSEIAGFASLGINKISDATLSKFHNYLTGKNYKSFKSNVYIGQKKDLKATLYKLQENILANGCPVCLNKEELARVVYRDEKRNYVECEKCGLVYQDSFNSEKVLYGESYFFEEYKAQYGKTYLEDFDHIKKMGLERIKTIKKYCHKSHKILLDVGCAYGAFLQAASEAGFDSHGLDISREAVSYVKNTLELQASTIILPRDSFPLESADVITMWYVIEHFREIDLLMNQISTTLKKGGLLAFSTPKGDGLSAKLDLRKFYEQSPVDHYIIFSKVNISKFLSKYGFKLLKIKTTGVHVKRRYPNIKENSLACKVLSFLYRARGLGDTFEIYAEKL